MFNNNENKKQNYIETKQNKKPKFKISYLIIVVCIFYATITFISQSFALSEARNEIDDLNKEKEETEQRQTELEKEVENLNKKEYIEAIARTDLGLIREGEEIFVDNSEK